MIPTTAGSPDGTLTRRHWLQRIAATVGVAIGGAAVWNVPTIWARNIKNVTLRQFCIGVSNINEISRRAEEDLGFTLTMKGLDSDAVVQRAVTQPKSYDIADIEYWMAKKVVSTDVILHLDRQRFKLYDKIVPVFITGKLPAEAKAAQGPAPHTVEFVTGTDLAQLAAEPTR